MIGFLVGNLWWIAAVLVLAGLALAPALTARLRWPIAVGVAAAFAAVFWLQANDLRRQIAERDTAAAEATRDMAQAARSTERATTTDLHQVDTTLQETNQHAQADVDAVRADRDGGELRLRDGLRCPAPTARVPDAPAAAGERDAAEAGGLSRADEDLLVRLAADADTVARQLTACQATVRVYLDHLGGAQP